MFTHHSKNYQSKLQHNHFLTAHTQFNSNNNYNCLTCLNLPLPYLTILAYPQHLSYLCWSFTICVQVCASGMIPSAAYVIVTANCLMSFLPSKSFLTLTTPTCCPLIKFITVITWCVTGIIILRFTLI